MINNRKLIILEKMQFYFIFDKYEVEFDILYRISNHTILNYTSVKAYGALLLCLFHINFLPLTIEFT
jgi:hypothetical protein